MEKVASKGKYYTKEVQDIICDLEKQGFTIGRGKLGEIIIDYLMGDYDWCWIEPANYISAHYQMTPSQAGILLSYLKKFYSHLKEDA